MYRSVPDGSTLVSGGGDTTLRLWDVATGEPIRTLEGHTDSVYSVAFSPDGSTLVSGGGDTTLRLWDVATGRHLRTLEGHTDSVYSVAFSPDGTTLASGSWDRTLRLWDVATGAHIRTLSGHTGGVLSVAFSPDGSTLVSGGGDTTLRLWDVATGEPIRTLEGHTYAVFSVAFSPDGSTLVSGGGDTTLRLWDVATGEPIRTLEGHTYAVFSVAFSPDGSTLASGGRDILLWEIPETRISITVAPAGAPVKGDKLTLRINITKGKNVSGYQAAVRFDATSLRYVSSANGDYLPATSFFVEPVVAGNSVLLGASSIDDSSSGDGTLATITFEFFAIKESTLTLSSSRIVDSIGTDLSHLHQVRAKVVGVPHLREDINRDGVVDILDLTRVAESFGKDAERCVSSGVYGDVNNDGVVDIEDLNLMFALHLEDTYYTILSSDEEYVVEALIKNAFDLDDTCDIVIKDSADVNNDGIIDIVDLVLVAGALGNKAAAPAAWARHEHKFRKSDVQQLLSQVQQLHLIDPTSQRGILFLEQLLAALTPKKTALLPNYPNPFNPETWIPYQLAAPADVTVTIWTAEGKLVRTLVLGHKPVGMYQNKGRAAYWDGRNEVEESVASGVYFYTLTAGDFTATRKMLIRK